MKKQIEEWEKINLNEVYARQTPLEKVIGFKAAEETYDLLNLREQLILDLLIVGWNQPEIAEVFNVTQPSINSTVRRIRVKLANSKLKIILDARALFKEGRHSAY
jgi:predicted XRE-type DNA-binding protein